MFVGQPANDKLEIR